jgi:hypothetical protein
MVVALGTQEKPSPKAMLRRESLWALAPLAPYHHVETLATYKSLGMTNETDLDNALCK